MPQRWHFPRLKLAFLEQGYRVRLTFSTRPTRYFYEDTNPRLSRVALSRGKPGFVVHKTAAGGALRDVVDRGSGEKCELNERKLM